MHHTRRSGGTVLLLLAGIIWLQSSSLVHAQQPARLFVDAASTAAADQLTVADRTRIRSRTVTISLPLLGSADARPAAGASILLNLFDDTSYTAVMDRIDPTAQGFVWVGHIPAAPLSTVTLAVEEGVMYGTVQTAEGTYVVRSAGNGVHTIVQVDPDAFSPEAEPRGSDVPAAPSGGATADGGIVQQDDAPMIDVMVLYTPAAMAAAGGSSQINALIANSISLTNTSYINSNVAQRVRLVYSAPVNYTEAGDIQSDLTRVTTGAGTLNGVAALRNSYAADMVSLITNTPNSQYCGVAYLMTTVSTSFAPSAYSVVEQSCAAATLTFPHELGHNMGLRHDWYVDSGTTPYSYAHGHVNVGGSASTRWRTIMSYADKCSAQGVSCTRLVYWSNPALTYNGSSLGIPAGTSTACTPFSLAGGPCDADEHLALNNTGATVASFRRSSLAVTSLTSNVAFPVFAGTPVTWTAAANGGNTPYSYSFLLFDGSQWTVGRDWSASNTWTWTPGVAGTYSVQVWVRNSGSATAYDAWASAGPVTVSGPAPLNVVSLTSNLASPVAPGSAVTWTATTSGGTAPYSYKFWVYNGSTWTLGQDWSSANTWRWTPSAPGSYSFQVWARNAGSAATYDAWLPAYPFVVTSPPPLNITSLTANQLFPVSAGTPVTLSAAASGGAGPYSFKFWIYNGTSWTLGRDWGAASSFSWLPAAPGTYSFQVWARNTGSATNYDAWAGFGTYDVTSAAPLAITSLTADRTFALPAGTPVAWTALARGGTGPYTYRFSVFNGSAWTIGRDWNASASWTWIPPAAGTYAFQVWTRNAGSASVYDAWLGTGSVSIGSPAALSVSSVSAGPGARAIAGTPLPINASAIGGLGPYTYKFWVYDGTAWLVGQDWSSAASFNWVPPASGSYSFQIWVRNAGSGTTWDAWAPFGPLTSTASDAAAR